MNGLQIKLQLDDNQPARWFDVETINFDDEVCFTDGVGEHIEIEYQGEPLRIKSPSLTDDQQVVLEWLKKEYKRTKWSSPFGTVYSTINIHEMFVRMRLTKAQQFQVLAAFAEWGLKEGDQ